MKLPRNISAARRASGMLLVECVVYMAVFAILLGGITAVFFYCWDHSDTLIYTTGDINSALQTGERWRADIRAATGKITVNTTAAGEVVRIPEGARLVSYRFESGGVSLQSSVSAKPLLLLANVKTSQMTLDARGGVSAWRWELELLPRRGASHRPLQFTFEAAQTKP